MDLTRRDALFLDFDGTLVEFASTPEGVVVPDILVLLLQQLNATLNGALALISGRSIESLASLLDLPLSMSGSHGAEWRFGSADRQSMLIDSAEFISLKSELIDFSNKHSLLYEDKGQAIAIHFRQSPEKQLLLDDFIKKRIGLVAPGSVRVLNGHCVREVQPLGFNKGIAIERFMNTSPFEHRRPVYMGDDVTDEDGFMWVNQQGGLSIKVGPGETCATHRLSNCGEVFAFLQEQFNNLR